MSRIGRIGPLVWYMPLSANYMLREVGIVLFLGAVGLHAGDVFVDTLVHGPGLYWMAAGALVTVVPLVVVATVGRAVLRLNFLTLCGLLAGSMTETHRPSRSRTRWRAARARPRPTPPCTR